MDQALKFARMARKLKTATAATVASGAAVVSMDQLAVLFIGQLLANYGIEDAQTVAQGLYQVAMVIVPPLTGIVTGWLTTEPAASIDWSLN